MTKGELAKHYFLQGANCAQAVLLAYAEECGISHEMAMKMGSSMGAGMGRMREVCGAVSGMFLVLGLRHGYTDLREKENKDRQYKYVQQLADLFKQKTGSIICADMLGLKKEAHSPISSERTQEYYKKRPCADLVALAADIYEHFEQTIRN